ncbi:hypothetical protein HMPREF9303_2416 [Prevotella denticola CRIS 18C-A]|uniref:Lipoprotein n=1 Tax=Prevotella denticola CRIS 18C-A TaxID=944557 RepID=F0H552_9BACT|nr:hypothetical protein HMPREF9303_2416 [Prevotella denticola CRIS 18C-A]
MLFVYRLVVIPSDEEWQPFFIFLLFNFILLLFFCASFSHGSLLVSPMLM